MDIKKILHEEHIHENLDVDLSVADVFVQHGRASADGQDQRATAIVQQKPLTQALFVREDSVVQDWASAATASRSFSTAGGSHSFQPPAPSIVTIPEDESSLSHTSSHINNEHIGNESAQNGSKNSEPESPSYDIPMQSVEREQPGHETELPESPTWKQNFNVDDREIVESSPQLPREASEELGAPEPPKVPHTLHPEQIDEERSAKAYSREPSGSPASNQNLERQQSVVKDSQPTSLSQEVPRSPRETNLQPELQHEIHELPDKQAEKETVKEPEAFGHDQSGDIDMADPDDLPEPSPEPTPESQHSAKPLNFKDKLPKDIATKRKRLSLGELPHPKEPRLDLSTEPSTPLSRKKQNLHPDSAKMQGHPVSPSPKRHKGPLISFSSPQKGTHPFLGRPPDVPEGCLGFGITDNPRRYRPPQNGIKLVSQAPRTPVPAVEIKLSSSQLANMTPSRSEKSLTDSGTKLRSALRKDGLSDRSRVRRSISFVDDEPNDTLPANTVSKASSKLAQSMKNGDPSPPEPQPTQSHSEGVPTPSSITSEGKRRSASVTPKMIWPSDVPQERIERYRKEAKLNSKTKKVKAKAKYAETSHADEPVEEQTGSEKRSNASKSSTKSATLDANSDSIKAHVGSEHPSSGKSKKSDTKRKSHSPSDYVRVQHGADSDGDNGPRLSQLESTVAQCPMTEDDNLPPTEKKIREETSNFRVEKTRSTPDRVTPNVVSSTKSKAASRTISQMNTEDVPGDSHNHKASVQRAGTPVEPANFNSSQSSMATKQLHSELESAHNQSPIQHGSPQIQQTADTSPGSSSGSSESDSDSGSDSAGSSDSSDSSDSDSDSDSDSGPKSDTVIESKKETETEETKPASTESSAVAKLEPEPGSDSDSDSIINRSPAESDSDDDDDDDKAEQPTTPSKSPDNVFSHNAFGSNNSWTPVNTKKLHTFSSVREAMRREQEATKAAANTKPPANGTKKVRRDIFEMSSSDSDSSDDDSDNDGRGNILLAGKEETILGRAARV